MVVNATGVFVDSIRKMDEPGSSKMLAVSQGAHLVLPKEFLPGTTALMVPKTSDGRVLFGIPWHDRLILGTTDGEVPEAVEEPRIQEHEIAFIFSEAARYLAKDPLESDVLSCYAGLRPLVKAGHASSTAGLSREHTLLVSAAAWSLSPEVNGPPIAEWARTVSTGCLRSGGFPPSLLKPRSLPPRKQYRRRNLLAANPFGSLWNR